MHSIPRTFGVNADGTIDHTIPASGAIYGQHMACFSLTGSMVNELARNMNIEQPDIYHRKYESAPDSYKDFKNFAAGAWNKQDRGSLSATISVGSSQWEVTTKSRYSSKMLWDEVVAPKYGEDLWCLTWGRPFYPSLCNSGAPTVENIDLVKADGGYQWKSSQNHAKLCVAKNPSSSLVCFGDMNR